jgi:hypothetical protein
MLKSSRLNSTGQFEQKNEVFLKNPMALPSELLNVKKPIEPERRSLNQEWLKQ